MKNILWLALFIYSTDAAFSQTIDNPESVEYDTLYHRWLISSTNNSTIQQRDTDGVISLFVNVASPYGLQILGDSVYVCSQNRIKGFSLANGGQGTNLFITGSTFLNGLASDTSGHLFATDFSSNPKRIYKIYLADQTYTTFATLPNTPSPNGIIHDPTGNRLVFVHWSANAPIKSINLVDSSVTTILTTSFNSIDGIARDQNGNFYLSEWGSDQIHKYNNDFSVGPITIVFSGLSNPADLFYEPTLDTLAIPSTATDLVMYFGIVQPPPPSITSVTISPDSLICVDDTIQIFYNVASPFNTGNVFYAVISDSTGNFSDQDTLSSANGTTGAAFTLIGISQAEASGYRIRVLATDPMNSGPDNGQDLTITTCLPPSGIQPQEHSIFEIGPNPFGDKLTITSNEKWEGRILSISGKLFWEGKGDRRLEVNTEQFPSGLYLMQVKQASSKELFFKIIKN